MKRGTDALLSVFAAAFDRFGCDAEDGSVAFREGDCDCELAFSAKYLAKTASAA